MTSTKKEDPDQLKVLVLTAQYVPHAFTTWQEGICLIYTNKCHVLEEYEATVSSPRVTIRVPSVVALRKEFSPNKKGIKFSRANVYQRDRHQCFAAGTRILMSDGRQVAIERVRPGDRVIDAHGDPQSVVTCGRRIADNAVSVKRRGSFERTVTTPDHPFLTSYGEYVAIDNRPEYLVFPRSVRYELPTVERTYETWRSLPADKWMRLKNGRIYWSRRGHESGLPVTITSSDAMAYMLGLYVAEGSASQPGTVSFSFCDDEEATLAADAARLLAELLGLRATVDVRKEHHVCVVRVGSKALAMLLRALCGKGACNKRVPWEMVGSHHASFLRGLFLGDGTIDRARRKVALGMTSYDVVYGAQSMLWGLGIYPTVQTWDERHGHRQTWVLVMQAENYTRFMQRVLGEDVEAGERIYGDDRFVFRRLQDVSRVEGDVVVYNLETTGSHSYVANGLAVHNCCYCGGRFTPRELTYDHVIPRSRWKGPAHKVTDWEQIVTSCKPCNRRKDDRTPQEAGMKMHYKPHVPKSLPMGGPVLVDIDKVHETQRPYLVGALAQAQSA